MQQDPDIAIIGAGAAGIGAARRLRAAGFSVLILEALPRLGGRAWTVQDNGAPLDLGCGWLHSGDRNPWTQIAVQNGVEVDRRPSAWDTQYRDLGFPPAAQAAADAAFEAWRRRLIEAPPASDIAAEAMRAQDAPWRAYLQALSGFISGDELERISAQDYATYDMASTAVNWRLPAGYGTLIAGSLPAGCDVRLSTPVQSVSLDGPRVALHMAAGTVHARAVIVTISTNMLAGDGIAWPSALDPWRQAASLLPLGNDEKLFLEITGGDLFEAETHLIGDPHDPMTGSFYIRPFGRPVIEVFLGGEGARRAAQEGQQAAFARATAQLAKLFGAQVWRHLRPLVASDWTNNAHIGGAYSHALPGHAGARAVLARPFEDRLFFAGEATNRTDFSTAHGAYLSGLRAAEEAIAALG